MTAFRRGRRAPFVQARRRETTWLDVPIVESTLAAGTAALLLTLTTAEKARRPFTVVRTRIVAQIISDQVAASERPAAALGACVVSDQAVSIGVTAVPTPVSDATSELWFLHQVLLGAMSLATAVGFGYNSDHYMIDSKAMRKVQEGEDLIFTLETDGAVGAIVNFGGRLLIKEH